jgi:hypothetical protein
MPSGVAGVMVSIVAPDGVNDCFKALYFHFRAKKKRNLRINIKQTKGK